jgi:hypothetical protein
VRRCLSLAAVVLTAFHPTARAAERSGDVVVYGATAAGVVAAVSVAREGKRVLLVDPDKHVGGMVTGGLGATDTGNRAAIGGYSREFFDRVRRYYVTKYGKGSPQVKDCADGFRFEPHVATLVFREMLAEAKVAPLFEQRLEKVTKKGAGVVSISTSRGDTFTAKVFIDASYEGDLMARAGVKYHVGRESRDTYKEPLAGVQTFSRAHQWPVKVDGRLGKVLLPLIQDGPLGKPGKGDRKVQAYNFRLCMTDRKDNLVPWPKPANYDPARFELLARYLKARPDTKMGQLMHPVRMPNGKTDTNNNGPISTDHIGASWDYPEGDEAARRRIWQDHVDYTQGFFWFLAHDERVPKKLQQEVRGWGLAKDEFTDTHHWPHQLYVREARRMIGQYVMTQADIIDTRRKDDAVGLGSYNADSHHVQRVVREDGSVLNEGDFQVPVAPYAIPYGALAPKAAECDNLLVPVCLSASHVAYGSIRMEPVYMILGQASGVAAALAVRDGCPVQKVDVKALTARLKEQKAILSPDGLPGRASAVRRLDAAKLAGVVVDDAAAVLMGEWKRSSALGPFVGDGYLHDGDADKGKLRARFVPRLPAAGRYEVRLYYAPGSNRARDALVVVRSKDGEKEIRVDQRKGWKGDSGVSLGVFTFDAGEAGWVEVRNDGTTGHVIADAVGFVPK